jgi:ATP synthase F1 gamma subunit
MYNEKSIKLAIYNLETLRDVARAYAVISSGRMRKTRSRVISSREFVNELDKIFNEIIYYYQKRVIELARKKKVSGHEKITFLPHNGKSVAFLISANTGLYGDVMQATFEMFLAEVRKKGYEVAIAGKLGLSQFLEEEPSRPYTFFDLSDNEEGKGQLSEIIRHLVQYEEIYIFYPRFKSIVSQVPATFNISANTPLPDIFNPKSEKAKRMYIFEPSIESILVFFEQEIFGSIFEQSVGESYLAKYASRMLAMDRASENVKAGLARLRIERSRIGHYITNKKQAGVTISNMLFNVNQ